MAQENKLDLKELERGFQQVWRQVPTIAGAKAASFFKMNFRRQGWVENGKLRKWEPRKKRDSGRAILVKSGQMWNDIRVLAKSRDQVQIGTTLPRAKAHNEGEVIQQTVSVPGFRRKGYKRKAHTRTIGGRRQKVKASQVSATKVKTHQRKMNTRLPKRQFIGESPDVIKSVEREVFRAFDQVIKSI